MCCLQALNIPTKINKGTVEIVAPVSLVKEGEKVGASEATLLAKLGIKPFSYGLIVTRVSLCTALNGFMQSDRWCTCSVTHMHAPGSRVSSPCACDAGV